MEWLNVLVFVLQILFGIAAVVFWGLIKKLPETIYKRHEQSFQHDLDRKLESFKDSLTRELELLKISHAELQIRKTEQFIEFANVQRELLTDKELLKKIESGDFEAAQKMQNHILKLATGLFFFASDETVRNYGQWKTRSITKDIEGVELLREYGELMVALRKDLGQSNTELTADDYLRLFITDWHKYENI